MREDCRVLDGRPARYSAQRVEYIPREANREASSERVREGCSVVGASQRQIFVCERERRSV